MDKKKTAEVLIRSEMENRIVSITNSTKPKIGKEMQEKWQRIINILAKILNVPAGLIMQITEDSMVVFLKSQNKENPYSVGENCSLGNGLYCETVIGKNKELLIDNALKYDEWKNNPDVAMNMVSYYGLPIQWEDHEFFGTICVLDNKTNAYNETYKELLNEFKLAIESDLKILQYRERLKYYAEMDILTSTFNRNKIECILIKQFEESKKTGKIFSLSIMDINKLKKINDTLGHVKGDEIIKVFANNINSRIRKTDSFGRWGGDEFLLICPNTEKEEMNILLKNIQKKVIQEMKKVIPNSSFCYGFSECNINDDSYIEVLKRADENLYKQKEEFR